MVFKGPGLPKGEQREALVYLHSIFPTVCDVVDLPIPASVDAKSLAPAIQDVKVVVRPVICAGYIQKQRMATDGPWKLILYPNVSLMQLFDLQSDPWETRNLAGDASLKAHSTRLFEAMRVWGEEVEDPWEAPADLSAYSPAP